MPDTIEIKIPNIGDFTDVPIVEIFVEAGDQVKKDDPLVALESDKAVMEVPAPFDGKIISLTVALNDTVSEGDTIATMEATGEAAALPPSAEKESASKEATQKSEAEPSDTKTATVTKEPVTISAEAPALQETSSGSIPHASPSIRLFARELGVDLSLVEPSGPKGRITKEDVEAFVKTALSKKAGSPAQASSIPVNVEDFKKYGSIEIIPFNRIQKISSPRLQQSWQLIPHVTHFDEADIEDLESFRKQTNLTQQKKEGVKLTLLAFAVKASVIALKEYPEFNASVLENGYEYVVKRYYNIGFAVDTKDGLLVPVIKDADKKGLLEIGSELKELGEKARNGALGLDEISGATFTISSLGSIGGTGFTPIILPPQVAILGLSRGFKKPAYNDDKDLFVPRFTLPFSLSYDHRLIDGALAARFCACISRLLADVRNLLL